ncbi:MAG: hypothetical protein CVT89_08090 [Candidatus Altiarchaeales archaeon HGW-Altiarchaeales-2]|nr:MAG: hypothetical protein CVT89_08090 [Candidatus Altiarchaeales archaeon HGW-Altiarchaeales-2]
MKEIIIRYNPWWHTGKISEEKTGIRRSRYLNQILSFMDSPEIIKIVGVRRSGKTTLIFQLIDFLLKKGVDPKNICYVQMDDEEFSFYDKNKLIKQVIDEYQEICEKNIEKDRIYFLFDEIQYIDTWPGWLKTYYDNFKNVKFIVSGSSSTLIDKDSVEKLSGRQIDFMIQTLSFREFLEFNNIEIKFQNGLFDVSLEDIEKNIEFAAEKNELRVLLKRYLETGGFPNVVFLEDEKRRIILKQYFRDIVYRDIIRVFKIRDAELLDSMFLKTFLYYEVNYYSTALKSTIRKAKKIYCADIGLRNAIITERDEGEAVENVVFRHLILSYDKIYYWDNKYECDFIVKTYENIMPIEVKYSDDPKRINGLLEFMENFGVKRGIVVTKDILKKEKFSDCEVLFIPLRIFLLLF